MITREDIVKEARSWLGTRFHHQGRAKGVGCDCIGLIVGVVRDLQITSPEGGMLCRHDTTNYGRIPNGRFLKDMLEKYLTPIDIKDVQAGDILLFHFEKEPQHVAIVSDYHAGGFGIIHCYASSRKVVEHSLDDLWKSRIISAFSFYRHCSK